MKDTEISGKVFWKSFEEVARLEKKNRKITELKKEIDKISIEEYQKLSFAILDFLDEVLKTAGKGYEREEELREEIYWMRYAFLDEDEEDSLLLDEVSIIFCEFFDGDSYSKLIKMIEDTKKALKVK